MTPSSWSSVWTRLLKHKWLCLESISESLKSEWAEQEGQDVLLPSLGVALPLWIFHATHWEQLMMLCLWGEERVVGNKTSFNHSSLLLECRISFDKMPVPSLPLPPGIFHLQVPRPPNNTVYFCLWWLLCCDNIF